MKKFRSLFPMTAVGALAVMMFASCADDGDAVPGPDPVPPVEDAVELAAVGAQQTIAIPVDEPWEATSSADWLQLSQMGGKGGESVQIVAARNLTGVARTGYIRFGSAMRSRAHTRAAADSSQIVVHQPAGEADEAPGVVLTAARYENGGIYVDIYNGRESTSTMQQLASESAAFPFTDPNASTPSKEPIVYIKKGQTYTANPYVVLNADGVAEGKFSIAGEASVNTLRVKQNIVFHDLDDLANEGSANIHFTDGSTIYYGGGIMERTTLGNVSTTPCYDFRSYNTATGEEKTYADIPEDGAGAMWDGMPLIVGPSGIYSLSGGKWHTAALRSATPLAASVEGNSLYVVTADNIETYALAYDGNGNMTATPEGTTAHGQYFAEPTVTSDGNGTTWLLDDLFHRAHALSGGTLRTTDCTPTDSLSNEFSFIGVVGNQIYAMDGGAVTRYAAGIGSPEPLRMLGSFEWYGAVECVDGRLYNFGGLTQYRGTYTASQALRRFSPADYVPVSVVILPD